MRNIRIIPENSRTKCETMTGGRFALSRIGDPGSLRFFFKAMLKRRRRVVARLPALFDKNTMPSVRAYDLQIVAMVTRRTLELIVKKSETSPPSECHTNVTWIFPRAPGGVARACPGGGGAFACSLFCFHTARRRSNGEQVSALPPMSFFFFRRRCGSEVFGLYPWTLTARREQNGSLRSGFAMV